ncbi:uncharacterized protein L199_006126 [Kwoniella botswanensis]|uniref:uncharacterized protein n=1 Tax=Kwoniella botswanensis TaxID=1268659 RepID=UPI00315D3300
MPNHFTPLPPESTSSTIPTSLQRDREGEEELVPEDDDEPPTPEQNPISMLEPEPEPEPQIELRPKKKAKRLKNSSSSPSSKTPTATTLITTSHIDLANTVSSSPLDDDLIHPKRPKIKSNNAFWRKAPPPPSSSSSGGSHGEGSMKTKHTEFPFADYELGLRPLTWPSLDDTAVKTLGIPASLPSFQHTLDQDKEYNEPFLYTRSDLIRYRLGKSPNYTTQVKAQPQVGRSGSGSGSGSGSRELMDMTIAEGAWKKWEEIGGIPKGLAGVIPYSFDGHGNVYKPDLTHVQAIRLVIAASPRGKMTLSQIYQAFEERWPWHKTAGMTWKNSIRHNLSLNDCFINVEKATAQEGGKGGYWIVDNSQSGRTARKLKRSAPNTNSNSTSEEYSSSPTKSTFKERDLLTKDRLSISGESSPATRNPNVDVFSPVLSNPLDKYDLNKSSDGGMTKGKNKATSITIAKPAVPFPYTLPQRDKSWIPKEVVRKSREIGIQRPPHDTPLDRPQQLSSHTPIDGRTGQDHGEGEVEGCRSLKAFSNDISPLESQYFTTRAGIPELPMVEPRSRSIFSTASQRQGEGNGNWNGNGDRDDKLPNLVQAVYEPGGLEDNVRLPPVRVKEDQLEDGDDEGEEEGD